MFKIIVTFTWFDKIMKAKLCSGRIVWVHNNNINIECRSLIQTSSLEASQMSWSSRNFAPRSLLPPALWTCVYAILINFWANDNGIQYDTDPTMTCIRASDSKSHHIGIAITSGDQELDSRTRLNLRYRKKWRFGTCELKFRAKCETLRIYHLFLSNSEPHFCLYLRCRIVVIIF